MANTLIQLGVPSQIISWTHSFMSQQTVQLTFNNSISDTFNAELGTPQGSSFSPLLSAIFTSLILWHAEAWDDGDFCFYIDDSAIYMGGTTFRSAISKAMSHLEMVCNWLKEFRLCLDLEKTRLMAF
jgi:hypothetical protein